MWARRDVVTQIIDAGRRFYNIFFRRLLLKHIAPHKEMIELGCGSATLAIALGARLKTLVGVDLSEEAIKISQAYAQHNSIDAEFIHADIFNLPENLKGRFDLVWSQGLMEHFEDYAAVIRAHYEVAKPGGTILISVPFKYSYIYLWYLFTRNEFLKHFWPYADQKFLTHRELCELGPRFSKHSPVYLLPPSFLGLLLGIIILEIKKDHA